MPVIATSLNTFPKFASDGDLNKLAVLGLFIIGLGLSNCAAALKVGPNLSLILGSIKRAIPLNKSFHCLLPARISPKFSSIFCKFCGPNHNFEVNLQFIRFYL